LAWLQLIVGLGIALSSASNHLHLITANFVAPECELDWPLHLTSTAPKQENSFELLIDVVGHFDVASNEHSIVPAATHSTEEMAHGHKWMRPLLRQKTVFILALAFHALNLALPLLLNLAIALQALILGWPIYVLNLAIALQALILARPTTLNLAIALQVLIKVGR
jgi:hypothetical protein